MNLPFCPVRRNLGNIDSLRALVFSEVEDKVKSEWFLLKESGGGGEEVLKSAAFVRFEGSVGTATK
jgi:hypothetical protein